MLGSHIGHISDDNTASHGDTHVNATGITSNLMYLSKSIGVTMYVDDVSHGISVNHIIGRSEIYHL